VVRSQRSAVSFRRNHEGAGAKCGLTLHIRRPQR
jgi:hypothetical protein